MTPEKEIALDHKPSRLKNFGISWFGVVMGMFGFAIAVSRAEEILHLKLHVSPYVLALTAVVSLAIASLYLAKAVRYPRSVLDEVAHPQKISFMPTITIGLILTSIAFLQISPSLSFWTWVLGTAGHFFLTLYVVSSWVHHTRYDIKHLNPAWFIPVVGNILVPVAGVSHAPIDVSWFFFSLGLFFWPVLMSIIFYRLLFHGSLPERFIPTLFILIAPPAVALISWYKLTGSTGDFGRVMYGIALFFFVLILFQAKYFVRLKFYLSWWAYSFPVAAMTIATLIMGEESGPGFYHVLAVGLLVCLAALVALLIILTGINISRKAICVEEDH
ncbi:MAG: SLAC1 anion channel family protein [Proteobacteria bacterium]|nr:SLAC1 anion channel family protein [Pseudomonadota bacterium]